MADLMGDWSVAPGTNPGDGMDIDLAAHIRGQADNVDADADAIATNATASNTTSRNTRNTTARNTTSRNTRNTTARNTTSRNTTARNMTSRNTTSRNANRRDVHEEEEESSEEEEEEEEEEEDDDDNDDDPAPGTGSTSAGTRGGRGGPRGRGSRGRVSTRLGGTNTRTSSGRVQPIESQSRAMKGVSWGLGDPMANPNCLDMDVTDVGGRVVRGHSQAIDTGADPESIALALEAEALVTENGMIRVCSSCSDFGDLKKCVRPGCPHALCFSKTNLYPCIREVGDGEFWCPPCWSQKRQSPLPYKVVAQGAYLTSQSRIRRPLLFHTIALNLQDYPETLLRCQLDGEYQSCRDLLHHTKIRLENAGALVPNVRRAVKTGLVFLKNHPLANLLVLVDSHSDHDCGELVHGTRDDGEAVTRDAEKVLRHYIGPELWKMSEKMSGTKGMILLACGPTFTVRSHFEIIKNLVSSKRLHFIIGFTAYSVQPTIVMPFMLRIAVEIYIYKKPVELAVEQVISSWTLLCHTPVVLVCWTKHGELVSRRYLASTPSGSVWGLTPRCGDRTCQAGPGDIKITRGRQKDKYLKFHCNRCGCNSPGYHTSYI
ncbi:uncharacterized protein EDB93DRAFT_1274406 [Suillus bovinus]|uniref:uncharacterized protein n=1 Tax=Suillus bovinus TaxID=48563 RepID=UPI001B868D1B|nr:uncharacterized protein EDB93DRAFT_1274406 [Suillus bovinus]KAG2126342.1 hypothetical protein EDB93DRAFT_1274406 [Suillus bovinus]